MHSAMEISKKRKIFIVLAMAAVVLVAAYFFFMHTVRGGSISLCVVGGWGAPIETRWKCAAITDLNVDEKFTLPLDFDQSAKDALKGFWYYSYYRQCLFDNGYDFSGDAVPPSKLVPVGEEMQYKNTYGGFSFSVPKNSVILHDNKLDVDFNDKLLVSALDVGGGTLTVHTYLKDDDYKTIADLNEKLTKLTFESPTIEEKEIIKSDDSLEMLRVRDASGIEGLVYINPDGHVVFVMGSKSMQSMIDGIGQSLKVFPVVGE